jgi:predicted amidohydrolase YtcJ
MPQITTLTWTLTIVVVVIATWVAVVKNTQSPLQQDQTYCYRSIKTLSLDNTEAKCFSVSPNGIFTQVFKVDIDGSNVISSDKYVIPGLWDGHAHLIGLGELLQTAQLYGSKDLDDVLERTRKYMDANPGIGSREDWISGMGWDQAVFGRMPQTSDFDKIPSLRNKYILLYRVDIHCIWVSKSVADLLPSPIPQVPGGEVIGDGVLCDNAMDMVLEQMPKPTKAKTASYIRSAMKKLNAVGIVGIHEAGVFPDDLKLYNQLVDTDDWTIRVYAMLECKKRNTFCADDAVQIERDDGRLIVKGVKLFAGD